MSSIPVWPQKSHDHEFRICQDNISLGIELQYDVVRISTQSKLKENNLE